MGLFNFLGIGNRPAPTPIQSSTPVANAPAADAAAEAPASPVMLGDTFEPSGEAPMCSLDGTGPNACFPDFARAGSGGGGKSGGAVDLG